MAFYGNNSKLGDASYDVFMRDFEDVVKKYSSGGGGSGGNNGGSPNGGNHPGGSGRGGGRRGGGTGGRGRSEGFLERTANVLGAIEDIVGSITGAVKQMLDPWIKVDNAASAFAKHIAMSAAGMKALRAQSIKLVTDAKLGVFYNARPEDLIKMQESYIRAIGRTVMQNNAGLENIAAMRAVMGEDQAMGMATKLEKFGLSMTEAGRRAGAMFQKASKSGVSFEVYSENFLSNIELAQKYTFKDGLNGLANMAKKATEVRLNMSQAAALADKVGTVEGAITTGANLQVLGGSFAQFANPLQMLNESLNDMEGLQDRIVAMFGNLGTFNKETGETTISSFNRQRIKAATDAMGLDYGNIMEMINRRGVQNVVESQMRGLSQFDDKAFAELVKNVATIENGIAGVNIDGQFKSLAEITHEDQKSMEIMRNSDSDNIKDIAKRLRSWDNAVQGLQDQKDAIQANWAEKSGLGEFSKNLMKKLGEINGILYAILAFQGIRGAANMGSRIGRGFNVLFDRRGVAAGAGRRVGYASWGRVAGGASILGGIALGAEGISQLNKNKKNREAGQYRRGSRTDNNNRLKGSAMVGGGTGAIVGGVVGLSGTALGASLGAWAGPIGAAVGAAIGLGVGAIVNSYQKETKRRQDLLGRRGFNLKGDYDRSEVETLTKALLDNKLTLQEYNSFSDKLKEKMKKSGDVGLFPALEHLDIQVDDTTLTAQNVYVNGKVKDVSKAANGGLLVGPSHRNGGMHISGSNIEVEGGEFVVNKRATKANLSLLKNINQMGNGGIIKPRRLENGGAIPVTPSTPSVSAPSASPKQVSVAPINLNINGTIKLDAGNGNTVDMDALLKNPVFVQKMSKLVEEELNRSLHGGGYVANRGLSNI